MAIKKYIIKPRTVKFEDLVIGLRPPTVDQMTELMRLRKPYVETVREESRQENKNPTGVAIEGDMSILMGVQKYVAQTFACDPEDPTNPWFAHDTTDRTRDQVEDVPQDMLAAIWDRFQQRDMDDEKFDEMLGRIIAMKNIAIEKADLLLKKEAAENGVPLELPESETTNISSASVSPSPSTSISASPKSAIGIGIDSSKDSTSSET